MLEQFASHESEGIAVTLILRCGNGDVLVQSEQITDAEGFVHFDLALESDLSASDETSWEVVELQWVNSDGPQATEARVLVPGRNARLGVISDIDDTIMESGITGGLDNVARNWERVLAQMPDQRITVPGAGDFYSQISGGPVGEPGGKQPERFAASHNPFFYVSSSPWNLFSYLITFMRGNSLPIGPIALRDWGLNKDTFGHESHGSHKRDAIAAILDSYPDMKFAMIGDDTQGDLPAFAHAVKTHPQQVAAIFLRTASQDAFSSEERAARDTIKAANVPLWIGDTYATGGDFLAKIGLAGDHEAQHIVELVEHPGETGAQPA